MIAWGWVWNWKWRSGERGQEDEIGIPVPPELRQAIALLFGPGRTATLSVLILAVFIGGTWAVWRRVEKHVVSSPDYLITLPHIAITP